jgi:adenylate cyclase, class 2
MGIVNIEFKAKANDIEDLEAKLISLNPRYAGEDHQKDTYYNVNTGRLKLREGNIENALIWYNRENISGVKQSDILLYKHAPDEALKSILQKIHGIKVIVDKKRKIYFVDNVKIHFDRVEGLGTFIEVEAIDIDGSISIDKLKAQCDFYISFFSITKEYFVEVSYSDMILAYNKKK